MGMEGLSARERNRLKRKAKALGRNDSVRSGGGGGGAQRGGGTAAALSGGSFTGGALRGGTPAAGDDDAPSLPQQLEEEWGETLSGAWALQYAADQMIVDLLDTAWEVRHGAAMGLRELLRLGAGAMGVQAPVADETSGWIMPGGAGARAPPAVPWRAPAGVQRAGQTLASKRSLGISFKHRSGAVWRVRARAVACARAGQRRLLPVEPDQARAALAANKVRLEESALLLLAVLALDHFADYGSDQVRRRWHAGLGFWVRVWGAGRRSDRMARTRCDAMHAAVS